MAKVASTTLRTSFFFSLPEHISRLISFPRMESSLTKLRQRALGPVPTRIADMEEFFARPEVFQRYGALSANSIEEPFFRAVVGPNDHQSAIFASNTALQRLRRCTILAMDGTFKSRPISPQTHQLLVICGFVRDCVSRNRRK